MNKRTLLSLVCVLVLSGCTHVTESRKNHITGQTNEMRPKVQNPAARVVLAPVNIAPNIVSNFVVGLYPGDIWPIQFLLLPISAIIWGIQDTILGYPFWSPSALYE